MKHSCSIIFLFLFFSATAQQKINCGPVKLDSAANRAAAVYLQNNARPLYPSPKMITVYFHIVGNIEGTTYAATAANLDAEFRDLVSAYSSDNICFFYAGFDYIKSSKLDTNFNADIDAASLFNPYRVANCLDVFYLRKIKGNNPSCPGGCGFGGITLGLPNTFCLVASGNIGFANTVAHEVGHCFGLLHTFNDGNGYENINGSNGTTSADRVADTNADPYDYDSTCNTTAGCVYSGTCTDPNGQSDFSPPYRNLMSYWGGCYNNLFFTTGQFIRAESFINTNAGLQGIVTNNLNYTILPATISAGKSLFTAKDVLNTTGNILFNGSANVSCGSGSQVLLNPGLTASPGSGGFVVFGITKCN